MKSEESLLSTSFSIEVDFMGVKSIVPSCTSPVLLSSHHSMPYCDGRVAVEHWFLPTPPLMSGVLEKASIISLSEKSLHLRPRPFQYARLDPGCCGCPSTVTV